MRHTWIEFEQKRGSSLAEVTILVAVILFLFHLSLPMFSYPILTEDQESIDRKYMQVDLDQLKQMLSYAQQESIRRNNEVVICAYNDEQPNSCSRNSNISGWLVYVKSVTNNFTTKTVLDRQTIYSSSRFIANFSFGNGEEAPTSELPLIAFKPNGRPDRRGSWSICSTSDPALAKVLILTGSGQISDRGNPICTVATS